MHLPGEPSTTLPELYVQPTDPIPATIRDNGGRWPEQAVGWHGRGCSVTYSSGIALRNLTWVPAGQVERS